jgi:hypothetical protein
MRKFLSAAFILALFVALISTLVERGAKGQVTAIAPIAASSLSLGNSVTQVVAPNPTRRALLICNVGVTNDAWLAPIAPAGGTQITVAANGAGSFLLSRISAAGANVTVNCLNIPGASVPTGSAPIPGLVTAGFNGITNASTTPLTVWEF